MARDYGHVARRSDYREVPGWLREDYPALFSHPRLGERLAVYGLAFDVRQLLLDGPTAPPDEIDPHHPFNRIRRLVDGRTHLQWMEW